MQLQKARARGDCTVLQSGPRTRVLSPSCCPPLHKSTNNHTIPASGKEERRIRRQAIILQESDMEVVHITSIHIRFTFYTLVKTKSLGHIKLQGSLETIVSRGKSIYALYQSSAGKPTTRWKKRMVPGTNNYESLHKTHFILKCLAWTGCSEIVSYYYWRVLFPSMVSWELPCF